MAEALREDGGAGGRPAPLAAERPAGRLLVAAARELRAGVVVRLAAGRLPRAGVAAARLALALALERVVPVLVVARPPPRLLPRAAGRAR